MTDLSGCLVLVCGGTAGIGLAMARAFVGAGARVVVNGRDAERGARALKDLGGGFFEPGDTGTADGARNLVARVVAAHGAPDVLIVSGGAAETSPGLFEKIGDDEFQRVFETQFLNRVFPIRAAAPHMKEKGGAIIIVGTDAGRHATVGEALHGGFGAAKIMLTKVLAREFSRYKIRVNGLALTITTDTEAFDSAMARGDFTSQLFAKAAARFPAGRPPNAEEVARVALFLGTDASAQVSGQTISVNGGLSFGGW